jgi:hypothetical protein
MVSYAAPVQASACEDGRAGVAAIKAPWTSRHDAGRLERDAHLPWCVLSAQPSDFRSSISLQIHHGKGGGLAMVKGRLKPARLSVVSQTCKIGEPKL